MKETILFIRNGLETKRFHTITTLVQETVGQHSAGVAMFAYLLTNNDPSRNLILAALVHDSAEHIYGDIPAPSKRAVSSYQTVNDLENQLLSTFGLSFHLTDKEERILKIADVLDGMWFCYRERSFGNVNVKPIFGRYCDYLEELKPNSAIEQEIINVLLELWKGVDK